MVDQSTEGVFSPFLQKKRIAKAKKYLTGSILDIGCGNGALAQFCAPDRYLGFDINKDVIYKAKKNFPSHQFVSELPKGKLFSTIVLLAVIEHLSDPSFYLKNLDALLEKEGKIVLTTPNPNLEWVHTLGSKLKLFSSAANAEHEELINNKKMKLILAGGNLSIIKHQKFLLFSNQLFILKKKKSQDIKNS